MPSFLPLVLVLFLFLLFVFPSPCLSHQSFSFPTPISRDVACRISSNANCIGPCPRKNLREDMTPNNPSLVVKRGAWVKIHTMKNNHFGGFSRWTMVHVKDMYDPKKHTANVFLWSCADVTLTKCQKKNRKRDCFFDKKEQYYVHDIQIPAIYPDGVYVLGWVWVGGGERWGHFGDYYDCMYVKVKGGELQTSHRPMFKPGNSESGRKDRCRATVNKVGICWKEPCPGGGRFTQQLKPWTFTEGRLPKPLTKDIYQNPYRPKQGGSPKVKSLTIRSADMPAKVYTSSEKTRFAHMWLIKSMRVTVTCEVEGNVNSVTFYTNGVKGRTDKDRPFTIAGDWVEYRNRRVRYAPWAYDVGNKYTTISCVAKGNNGVESWMNFQLSTDF